MKKCLIWANGISPSKKVIVKLLNKGYSTIICADGGANLALKKGFVPDVIIGDFDSIEESVKEAFRELSEFVNYSRQSDTDVEKAIKFAIKKKFRKAVLIGATGNRLDHSFNNIGLLLKYYNSLNIILLHEKSAAYVIEGNVKFNAEIGETISLYGFDRQTRIISKGLKYPLENIALPFGIKDGTSNSAVQTEVELNITGGKILIVRELNLLFKNGYIF